MRRRGSGPRARCRCRRGSLRRSAPTRRRRASLQRVAAPASRKSGSARRRGRRGCGDGPLTGQLRRPFEAARQDARDPAAAVRGRAQEPPPGRHPGAGDRAARRDDSDARDHARVPGRWAARWWWPARCESERAAIERLFGERERIFSRFQPGSELNRVNDAAGIPTRVSAVFAEMLRMALEARRESGGLVDRRSVASSRRPATTGTSRCSWTGRPLRRPRPDRGER